MKSVKDLIYFDLEKARSLISQLNGGLISEISRAFENETEISGGVGVNVVIKANANGKEKEKFVKTEKMELYHELLNEIEVQLANHKALSHINNQFENWKGSFNDYMDEIPKMSYIKASGWGAFEDFERFKHIMSNFNEVLRLVFNSHLEKHPEAIKLKEQLKDAKKNMQLNTNSKSKAHIISLEKQLDKILEAEGNTGLLDELFVERVKTFLNTFTPHRLNFRLLPLDDFNEFQILANIKDRYIIDGDFESIIYTYGTRPNIKLTVLGIITSAPTIKDLRVDPNDEFLQYSDEDLKDTQTIDKVFRNAFASFEAFEKFFYVPSYPKIAISPIAIYREVVLQ
ncbi:MAG: hypothetical protein K0Q95_2093 [Bacteroidota bacterium]|jgi:hypothetical protein|nr:hypothetical protein [Bacteroidota bacterium]